MMCQLFMPMLAKRQTLAFSTAEGFGKYASGGRGGEVVDVPNSCDDSACHPKTFFMKVKLKSVIRPTYGNILLY